jgi:hypothetical protein
MLPYLPHTSPCYICLTFQLFVFSSAALFMSLLLITTGCGLDGRGSEFRVPVGAKIFASPLRPDRLWGTPKLLYNGYRGLLTPRKIHGTHFCQRLSRSQGRSTAGSIRSVGKSNYLIGNRTRDLPACSTVTQPTMLMCAPLKESTLPVLLTGNCITEICLHYKPNETRIMHKQTFLFLPTAQ